MCVLIIDLSKRVNSCGTLPEKVYRSGDYKVKVWKECTNGTNIMNDDDHVEGVQGMLSSCCATRSSWF